MKSNIIWGVAGFFGTILIVAIIAYLQRRTESKEETPPGIDSPIFSEEESRAGIIEINRENQTRPSR